MEETHNRLRCQDGTKPVPRDLANMVGLVVVIIALYAALISSLTSIR